jgi:hypothetical protein
MASITIGIMYSKSQRPLHGLHLQLPLDPTDELLGYYPSSGKADCLNCFEQHQLAPQNDNLLHVHCNRLA